MEMLFRTSMIVRRVCREEVHPRSRTKRPEESSTANRFGRLRVSSVSQSAGRREAVLCRA